LIPAAVGGSAIARWADGADLNAMMVEVIHDAQARYHITAVLLDQGAEDFARHTSESSYRNDLESLIRRVRAERVTAPFYVVRCSVGLLDWSEDNPIARAQAAIVDNRTVFAGPDTDHDITRLDRYDGLHFSASGQEKFTDAWIRLLQKQ
jgi:hypothetical protein